MKNPLPLLALALSCAGPHVPESVPSDQTLREVPLAPYPLDGFDDGDGRLWFGSVGSGAFCWTDLGVQEFHAADGLVGDRNMGFAKGPDGALWFTSAETHFGGRSALMAWSEHEGFRRHDFPDAMNGAIEGVHFDASGQMWLSGTAGIFQFDGEHFTPFEIPGEPKPMEYTPHRWFESSDGRIWLGTPDRGLWVWDGASFSHMDQASGLFTDNVAVLCEDAQGGIWISCFAWHLPDAPRQGGVLRWDGTELQAFPAAEGLHHNDVYSGLCDHKGRVWLGATGVGVYRFEGDTVRCFNSFAEGSPAVPSFGMNSISEDASGQIHFCFAGGLYHLTDSGFEHRPRTQVGRP